MARPNPFRHAAREASAVLRASTPTHADLRNRLLVIGVLTIVVDVVCGLLSYAFEHDVHGTSIHSVGDAFFFSTTQLLSVSSSLTNPISAPGKLLDVFMELYAITVVASLAGLTGAFFHRRSVERRDA